MTKQDIIVKVKELNLPKGEYMIGGSAILALFKIREAEDIDLLVSPNLYRILKDKYAWKPHEKYKAIISPHGHIEAKESLDFMYQNYTLVNLLPNAYVFQNMPFMNLEILREAKVQIGRPKDLKDIELIDTYLKNK